MFACHASCYKAIVVASRHTVAVPLGKKTCQASPSRRPPAARPKNVFDRCRDRVIQRDPNSEDVRESPHAFSFLGRSRRFGLKPRSDRASPLGRYLSPGARACLFGLKPRCSPRSSALTFLTSNLL